MKLRTRNYRFSSYFKKINLNVPRFKRVRTLNYIRYPCTIWNILV